jgi:HEPN domain-containing protein
VVYIVLDENEYSRWLKAAKNTLKSAQGDLERGDFNWACFKAQQASELSVKALLHGIGLPAYGHSVSKLLTNIPGIEVPEDILQGAITLDKYYVPARYPNAWPEGSPHEYFSKSDAMRAVKYAEEIIKWVEEVWKYLTGGSNLGGV